MRTGDHKGGTRYSPDDGDREGFLALVRRWVEEEAVPVPDRAVEAFCQFWAGRRQCNLRSKREWLNALRKWK